MRRWEGIAYSLFAALGVGIGLWFIFDGQQQVNREASANLRQSEILDCRIDNLPRARDLLATARSTVASHATKKDTKQLTSLLWCAETVDTRHPVLLTKEQQKIYLDLVEDDLWPVVDARGMVVGVEALPESPSTP